MVKIKRIALVVAACISIIVSIYASVVIFGTWLLVPRDPAMTHSQDIRERLGITAGVAVVLVALAAFAKWAFKKQAKYKSSG